MAPASFCVRFPCAEPGKIFVEVRLAVLLGRLPVEDGDGQRIGDGDGGDTAGQRFCIDGVEELAHGHKWKGFVTMDRCQDTERRAVFVTGENVKAKAQIGTGGQARHLKRNVLTPRF